jgi:Na+/H+ antiporter NhaB
MKLNIQNLVVKTKAFLLSLNTHTVAGVGLGTALAGITAIVGQHWIDPHLAFNPSIQWVFDYFAQQIAAPVTATAVYAAYLGRPKTVPKETKNDAQTTVSRPPTGAGNP